MPPRHQRSMGKWGHVSLYKTLMFSFTNWVRETYKPNSVISFQPNFGPPCLLRCLILHSRCANVCNVCVMTNPHWNMSLSFLINSHHLSHYVEFNYPCPPPLRKPLMFDTINKWWRTLQIALLHPLHYTSSLQTEIAIKVSSPFMYSDLKSGRASQSVVTRVLRFPEATKPISKREERPWGWHAPTWWKVNCSAYLTWPGSNDSCSVLSTLLQDYITVRLLNTFKKYMWLQTGFDPFWFT